MPVGVSYGFSAPTGAKREKGYILIPGLRTARVAPVVNIGMSAPDWIKFLVSYAYNEKIDFRDPAQMNRLIFHRSHGLFFQGLKWRIMDPSDAAGYGIGINNLNTMGILAGINPKDRIKSVSQKLTSPVRKQVLHDFLQIFTHSTIARFPVEDIFKSLNKIARFSEPRRTFELISITIDIIKESVRAMPIQEQNQIAGTIQQFISILEMMGIKSTEVSEKDLVSLLGLSKPGEIPPHLSPVDIAVILHELARNADTGGLPIVLSFIVSDILGAHKTASPEEILWEASHRLTSDMRIEQHLRRLYRRIANLINSKGFSTYLSEDEFLSTCSPAEIRREAIWWEYNLVLGKLEELMRDFVGPYRFQIPWRGRFRKEFVRLSSNSAWNRKAHIVLQRIAELANNVSSKDMYSFIIGEEELLAWFRDIQLVLNLNESLDGNFKKLWELADRLSKNDDDPVANYDSSTDTISLHKDPREDNPYIQRSIVYAWIEKFSRIWRDAS
jgi:hypothetical protein